jgi:hypothetical protein
LDEVKVDKTLRKRKLTASSSARADVPNPTPRQTKIAQMLALAGECGFACVWRSLRRRRSRRLS